MVGQQYDKRQYVLQVAALLLFGFVPGRNQPQFVATTPASGGGKGASVEGVLYVVGDDVDDVGV